MCGGRVAASPVKLALKVKMGILFPETSLEEKALRSMANQCEKALVFRTAKSGSDKKALWFRWCSLSERAVFR